MDKLFAISISGMYAGLTAGVFGIPSVFAQVGALNFLGLAERLGLGAMIAILGYLIIVKLIDVFERTLLTRLMTHDSDIKDELSDIKKKVDRIESQVQTQHREA